METVHICDTGTGIEPLVDHILSGIVVRAGIGGIGEGTEVQFRVSSFEFRVELHRGGGDDDRE